MVLWLPCEMPFKCSCWLLLSQYSPWNCINLLTGSCVFNVTYGTVNRLIDWLIWLSLLLLLHVSYVRNTLLPKCPGGSILTALWSDDCAFIIWFSSEAWRSAQSDSAAHPTFSVGTGTLSWGLTRLIVKLASPPSIADVENGWSCTFAPYAYIACTGTSFL
jgi:hypothetical protein